MYQVDETGRIPFAHAVRYAINEQQPLFCVVPVFPDRIEDEEVRAEGAKVFILHPSEATQWELLYVAGPFFTSAYVAHERYHPDEVPEAVRQLSFIPTWLNEEWLDLPIQVLIQKLAQAADLDAEIPDYESARRRRARSGTTFPVAFVGKKPSVEF